MKNGKMGICTGTVSRRDETIEVEIPFMTMSELEEISTHNTEWPSKCDGTSLPLLKCQALGHLIKRLEESPGEEDPEDDRNERRCWISGSSTLNSQG